MYRWQRRELKQYKKRQRMPKHGRSLFLLEEITKRRAEKAKEELEKKKRRKKVENILSSFREREETDKKTEGT